MVHCVYIQTAIAKLKAAYTKHQRFLSTFVQFSYGLSMKTYRVHMRSKQSLFTNNECDNTDTGVGEPA